MGTDPEQELVDSRSNPRHGIWSTAPLAMNKLPGCFHHLLLWKLSNATFQQLLVGHPVRSPTPLMSLAYPLYVLLGVLVFAVASGAASTVTLTPTDPSLSFASGWQQTTSQVTGRTFLLNDNIGSVLTVNLPGAFAPVRHNPIVHLVLFLLDASSSFTYFGFKRSGGSQYAFCLDCGTESSSVNLVDGHDPSLQDDSQAPLVCCQRV